MHDRSATAACRRARSTARARSTGCTSACRPRSGSRDRPRVPRALARMAAAGEVVAEPLGGMRDVGAARDDDRELDRWPRVPSAAAAASRRSRAPGLPGSICASRNDMIVHGIRGLHARRGDVLWVDIGVTLRGFVADSAVTLPIGSVDPERLRLLDGASAAVRGDRRDAGRRPPLRHRARGADHGGGRRLSVVRALVGHGVGRNVRGSPDPEAAPAGRGAGAEGRDGVRDRADDHGAVPSDVQVDDDGRRSTPRMARWPRARATVAVTADGPRMLTRPAAGSGRRRAGRRPPRRLAASSAAVPCSARREPGYHRGVTDDGPLDRAAALERATAATALPTGIALTVAAVVASDDPARAGCSSRRPWRSPSRARCTWRRARSAGRVGCAAWTGTPSCRRARRCCARCRASPPGFARAGAAVRARLGRPWGAVGGARRPAARRGHRRAGRPARAAALGAAGPRRRPRRPRPRVAVDAPRRRARPRRALTLAQSSCPGQLGKGQRHTTGSMRRSAS